MLDSSQARWKVANTSADTVIKQPNQVESEISGCNYFIILIKTINTFNMKIYVYNNKKHISQKESLFATTKISPSHIRIAKTPYYYNTNLKEIIIVSKSLQDVC